MKTFGIITISHKRDAVLKLWCAGIKRLRTEMELFIPAVVVGDAEHYEICSQYHIRHITQQNHPATRKWNTAVDYMMSLGMDYIVVLGSDDLISTDLLKNLITEMEKGTDLIGIDKVYFYAGDGKHKGNLVKHEAKGQILGVARCISSKVINQVGVLWDKDKSWGMDAICMRRILSYVKSKTVVDGVCCDIKTERQNLNNFSLWMGKASCLSPQEIFYSFLGEEEKQLLQNL